MLGFLFKGSSLPSPLVLILFVLVLELLVLNIICNGTGWLLRGLTKVGLSFFLGILGIYLVGEILPISLRSYILLEALAQEPAVVQADLDYQKLKTWEDNKLATRTYFAERITRLYTTGFYTEYKFQHENMYQFRIRIATQFVRERNASIEHCDRIIANSQRVLVQSKQARDLQWHP